MTEASGSPSVSGGSPLATVFDKISFVQKYPTLMKATEDYDTQTPGYLYEEISNLTFQSGRYCQSVLDFLVNRLEKNSYHIKLKVLRIMKYLVQNGHLDFRQSLRRQANGIKIAQGYNGPPHPLQGNSPYVIVRNAAKELLNILFDTELMNQECQLTENVKGPARSTLGGLGSASSSGKMEGFGNAPINPVKSLAQKIVIGLTELAEKVSNTPVDSLEIRQSSMDQHFGDYEPIKTDNLGNMFEEEIKHVTATNKRLNRKIINPEFFISHAGGGWEDPPEEKHNQSDQSGKSTDSSEKLEGIGNSDYSIELQLLDDFITGTDQTLSSWSDEKYYKHIQSWDEKKSFRQRCYSLNCLKISELINDKLLSDDPRTILRSLVAMEVIVQHELVPSETLLAMFKDNLSKRENHQLDVIKNKARKILLILNHLFENQRMNETNKTNSPKSLHSLTEIPVLKSDQQCLMDASILLDAITKTLPVVNST